MSRGVVCLSFIAIAISGARLASVPVPRSQPLVLIDVAVTDARGASTEGLTAADFEVLVDGNPKPIQSFAAPPSSLTIALILDVSASMTLYSEIEEEVTRSFAESLRPGDRGRVGGIATRLQLAPRFASTANELLADARKALKFREVEKSGPSPIWDALDAAAAALETEAGRRGLILITDGRSTGNNVGSGAAIQRTLFAGITVHVLTDSRQFIIRQGPESFARVRPGLALEELAQLTGGLYVSPDPAPTAKPPQAGPAIATFISDLRSMYTIGLSAEGRGGSLHRVQVKVKRPGLSVRTRSAYQTR